MYAMIQHRVRDFDKWHKVYSEHQSIRRKHGLSNERVYRSSDDKNEILVTCEVPSKSNLDSFLADPTLAEAMKKGGVSSRPTAIVGNKIPMPESKRR